MQLSFNLQHFEESSHENGVRYWIAHDFMRALGYDNWSTFQKVINKAMASCASLNIRIPEAFIDDAIHENGREVITYRLTRFACFLVTMHADSKKKQVAEAKVALAAVADALVEERIQRDAIDRLEEREELKIGEGGMCAAAHSAGLKSEEFGIFKDAGFRGMYNMSLKALLAHKGVELPKNRTLYDFMGRVELAANRFRVTQTEMRIKNKELKGLNQLSQAANDVGKSVRAVMIDNGGVAPETLTLEGDIKKVKTQLRDAAKGMKALDSPTKKKRRKQPTTT